MAKNRKKITHEFIVCSNIFVRRNGKYLMIKRPAGSRWMPNGLHTVGGKLEENENPYECAVRELKEEAGIAAKNIKLEVLFTELSPYKSEPHNWLTFYFSGDYKSGRVKGRTKAGELAWFTREELLRQKLHSSIRHVLEHILDPNAGTIFGTLHYDNKNTIKPRKCRLQKCVR